MRDEIEEFTVIRYKAMDGSEHATKELAAERNKYKKFEKWFKKARYLQDLYGKVPDIGPDEMWDWLRKNNINDKFLEIISK